jgi:hypothetical protein
VIVGLAPGSDPTIMSYNANIVKTYNTTRRLHTQYVIKTSKSSALILTKIGATFWPMFIWTRSYDLELQRHD